MKYSDDKANATHNALNHLLTFLVHRFSLREDKADDSEIERRIGDGIELIGATPWILIFAIIVASVGLNVNSTAVIIGAMLISPLMGPIMGVGLGMAVYDFSLVKRALLNLGIATLISLIVSALYFSISPLHQVQSELLARTTPTIWDVLIALFGGLAGIVGVTRKEKSNVIPGVAIATALMPPICTAGFGVATGEWRFAAGALYLYTINCVFIALATMIGLRILRLAPHRFADDTIAWRVKVWLVVLALCTALPSAYLAATLVNEEVFKSRARQFVDQEFAFPNTHAAELKIDPKTQTIELSLIGAPLTKSTLQTIEGRLAAAHLEQARIVVHQSSDDKVDVTALKSSLLSDLYRDGQEASHKKDAEILRLQNEIASRNVLFAIAEDIAHELRAQYPLITQVMVGEGLVFTENAPAKTMQHLRVSSSAPLSTRDRKRIEGWFKVRTKTEDVMVNFESQAPKARPKH
ncbi:TIGR00341 family protein [Nitrospira lenta]|uniref:TIGR00341 family protein n=1 Tax=Nitrospira lenta TaxID=1436998 RepID=A0A330LA77_9BACT|nr:TIGR00341 family protein [Nitrospira lenta]SPP66732.1 conserved membrane hypothetical protein [Nitrospira lenta]